MAGSRPQGRYVFAALVMTLILAALLGGNAIVTARYHRSVAEGVLRDYADFAAAELTNRVQAGLAQQVFPVLSGLAGGGRLAPAMALIRDDSTWRSIAPLVTSFRVGAGGLASVGVPLTEADRAFLSDTVPKHAAAVFSPRVYLAFIWLGGDPSGRVASIMRARDGSLVGLVIPGASVATLLRPALSRAPLLPPSLTKGAPIDSVLSFRLVRPDGVALVTPPGPAVRSIFRAHRTLDQMWGGLKLEVTLNEPLAGRLVIGGLPRSRLPVVAALLGLTAFLIGTAWFQLRRERELVRHREEFVAAVSHELRTPLAQIRLFAETLQLGRVRSTREQDQAIDVIDREARRLGQLVENLLTVSRTGGAALRVAARHVDLAGELRDAVASFSPLARAAGREATLTVAAPDRLEATADPDGFRQMVLNLLDNAVKYGPRGQTVTVSLAATDARVRLTVDDEGPGVPAADRGRVFERFVRLDREREAAIAGTGLGLSVVRDLARLHGGRAWVESASGGGARFVVELPKTGRG